MAASDDLRIFLKLQARCIALIPEGCKLLHTSGFWKKAEWDELTSEHVAQIWLLGGSAAERTSSPPKDLSLHALVD
jgi:hypothetical protein